LQQSVYLRKVLLKLEVCEVQRVFIDLLNYLPVLGTDFKLLLMLFLEVLPADVRTLYLEPDPFLLQELFFASLHYFLPRQALLGLKVSIRQFIY